MGKNEDEGQGIRAVQRWGGQVEKLGSRQEANLQRDTVPSCGRRFTLS